MGFNNTVTYIMTQPKAFTVNPGRFTLTSSGHVERHNNDYTTISELLVIKVKHGIFLGPSRRINTEIPTSQVRQISKIIINEKTHIFLVFTQTNFCRK